MSTNKSVVFQNIGAGTLSWTVNEQISWLSVSPTTGATDSQQNVNLSVNRSGLSAGSYSESFVVESNGGNKTVVVNMQVPQPIQGEWLDYDDGSFEAGFTVGGTGWLWMRFTTPSGWSSARVTKVKMYLKSGSSYSFDIDGFDDYKRQSGNYYPSGSYISLKSNIRQSTRWATHNVNQTFSSRQFFIAIWFKSAQGPYLGNDTSNSSANRCGGIAAGTNLLIRGITYGIQVFVEHAGSATAGSTALANYTSSQHQEKGIWLDAEVHEVRNIGNELYQLRNLLDLKNRK